MNKSNRTNSIAKHFYAGAYADYLASGDLEEATRQVAHQIYLNRGTTPGTQQGDWQEAERITGEWPHTVSEASQAHLFDKALAKTRQWLREVELELGMTNPNEAYRALRAVLHAIRDRLPVHECSEFASQLPTLLMGMYYTGWTPVGKPEKMRNIDEFLDKVADELPKGQDPMRITRGVIAVIDRHVSAGEMKDVRRIFPERMQQLWEQAAQPLRR
jgi:uncharacterized protein (DUF2267 family)